MFISILLFQGCTAQEVWFQSCNLSFSIYPITFLIESDSFSIPNCIPSSYSTFVLRYITQHSMTLKIKIFLQAMDNDGLPHTLEHLIFLGSEDYPYKEVLDLLANRALADRCRIMQQNIFFSEWNIFERVSEIIFQDQRLDGHGSHVLHRVHGRSKRLSSYSSRLSWSHSLSQPQVWDVSSFFYYSIKIFPMVININT